MSGTYYVGGLVGYFENSSITSSYWDKTTSGITTGSYGTGVDTEELNTLIADGILPQYDYGSSSDNSGSSTNTGVTTTSLTISSDMTYGELKEAIEAAGGVYIENSDGTISITGVELSGTFLDALNFTESDGVYTSQNISVSDSIILSSTGLDSLGFADGSEIVVTVEGVDTILTFNSDKTIQDVIEGINSVDSNINAYLNEKGMFVFSADVDVSLSGEIGELLISNGTSVTVPNEVIFYDSESIRYDKEVEIEETTTVGTLLGTNSSGDITVSIDGVTQPSQLFSSTSTVQEVIDYLDTFGIKAEIDNGVFSFTSDDNFELSGPISDAL